MQQPSKSLNFADGRVILEGEEGGGGGDGLLPAPTKLWDRLMKSLVKFTHSDDCARFNFLNQKLAEIISFSLEAEY